MTRLNLVLLLAVLASALYLVNVQYDSRRLPQRVEKLAREKLQMRPATPAITHYVAYSDASGAPATDNAAADGAARAASGRLP